MTEKVASGQSLIRSPLRKADFVNDVVDTVEDFKLRRLGKAQPDYRETVSTDRLSVQNLTGGDLLRGNVVQLGAYLLDNDEDDGPDFRNLWFEGNTPAAPADKRWAILSVPLKAAAGEGDDATPGDIGLAQLSGVCVAIVNVTDTSHMYAIPVAGNTVLQSSPAATAIEIVSPVTETGENTYAVRLGGGGAAGTSSAACGVIGDTPLIQFPHHKASGNDFVVMVEAATGCVYLNTVNPNCNMSAPTSPVIG